MSKYNFKIDSKSLDFDPVPESFYKSYETLQKYVEDYGNL